MFQRGGDLRSGRVTCETQGQRPVATANSGTLYLGVGFQGLAVLLDRRTGVDPRDFDPVGRSVARQVAVRPGVDRVTSDLG